MSIEFVLFTVRDGVNRKRYLKFDEIEITYSDSNFSKAVEIDIKNTKTSSILELSKTNAELKVIEGLHDKGSYDDESKKEQVSEEVIQLQYCGKDYFDLSNVAKIAKAIDKEMAMEYKSKRG